MGVPSKTSSEKESGLHRMSQAGDVVLSVSCASFEFAKTGVPPDRCVGQEGGKV
jgi:hypothetical protein